MLDFSMIEESEENNTLDKQLYIPPLVNRVRRRFDP